MIRNAVWVGISIKQGIVKTQLADSPTCIQEKVLSRCLSHPGMRRLANFSRGCIARSKSTQGTRSGQEAHSRLPHSLRRQDTRGCPCCESCCLYHAFQEKKGASMYSRSGICGELAAALRLSGYALLSVCSTSKASSVVICMLQN